MRFKIIGAVNSFFGYFFVIFFFIPVVRSGNYNFNILFWMAVITSLAAAIFGPVLIFRPKALRERIYLINKLILGLYGVIIFVVLMLIGLLYSIGYSL